MDIQQDLLTRLFNKMTEGILIIDKDWSILFANDSARRFLNLSLTETQIKEDLIPQLKQQYVLTKEIDSGDALEEKSIVFDAKTLEEKNTSTELALYLSRPSEDKIRFLLLRDVTEERREQRLKQGFLSLITHKLQTPISVIQGTLDNFAEGLFGALTERQDQGIKTVSEKAKHLEGLIRQLLTFVTLKEERSSDSAEVIDLASQFENYCLNFKRRPFKKPLHLYLTKPLQEMPILFNPEHLFIIIDNICNNAVKFCDKPEIKITINWGFESGENRYRLSISDNGPGIPTAAQPKVFDPFTQTEDFFTGNMEGLGLGLPTVRQLMKLAHGDVKLESSPQKGTTLHLYFPKAVIVSSGVYGE